MLPPSQGLAGFESDKSLLSKELCPTSISLRLQRLIKQSGGCLHSIWTPFTHHVISSPVRRPTHSVRGHWPHTPREGCGKPCAAATLKPSCKRCGPLNASHVRC